MERFRTGILVRFEEMSERWAVVSTPVRCFRPLDHAAIGLARVLIHLTQAEKKGRKNFCETHTKLFPTARPFFLPAPGVRAKHAKPLSAMLECSKIKQRERRSIKKCPVTFLQIKFFRLPQIATLKWICKDQNKKERKE